MTHPSNGHDLPDPSMIPAWVDGQLCPVEKLRAHQLGLRHRAVSVFVLHGSDVLIQKRAAGKYHTPLLWANSCCTHPHWGESSIACAQRRLAEELGLRGLFPTFRGTVEYRADVGNGLTEHEVVDLFLAMSPNRPQPEANPDEVADIAWVDFYDLRARAARHPDQFTPWLRIYLDQYADRILGHLPARNTAQTRA